MPGSIALRNEVSQPVSGTLVPLYNPRIHDWGTHFAWNEGFDWLTGLTPSGRATVEALNLNRPGVVNLRRILYAMGKHPLT